MLEKFESRLTQMQDLIASLHQNNLPSDPALSLLDSSLLVRNSIFLPAQIHWKACQLSLQQAFTAADQAVHGVLTKMQDRYRNDPASLQSLAQLPTSTSTPDKLADLMRALSNLWVKLPVPQDSPLGSLSFRPWHGMNRAVLDHLRHDLVSAQSQLKSAFESLTSAQAALADQSQALAQFLDPDFSFSRPEGAELHALTP